MKNNFHLKSVFDEKGFSFGVDNNDKEIPMSSCCLEREYNAVREQIGILDLSYINIYHISGEDALDYLDYIVCGDVASVREEEILHSCVIDSEGMIVSDVYVANDEDEFFLLVDGGDYEKLNQIMADNTGDFDVEVIQKNKDLAMFSVDGPYAWVPLKNVYSSQILGIGYLDFMKIDNNGQDTYIFRAGKTGEFGYWILTPKENALHAYNAILSSADGHEISLYGHKAAELFRLENHFFHYKEAKYASNPYELGLFWQIFRDKEMFTGILLQDILGAGISRWVTGFTTASSDDTFNTGDAVSYGGKEIGVVINKGYSYTVEQTVGRALLKVEYAHCGIQYSLNNNITIQTVPMPFVLNKSLSVKPE